MCLLADSVILTVEEVVSMYGIVLLAALGGSVDTPACGWGRWSDYSCGGWNCCSNYCYSGWGGRYYGRSYYSPYYYGCYNYTSYPTWGGYASNYSSAPVIADAPATVVVNLPADARLSIEGQATQSASGERTFVSPPVKRGKTFVYTLKADVDRNGEKVTASQTVEVRAGQVSRVSLNFPTITAKK
jgi:uncharacterized protein (TIGR03000 family)